MIFDTFRRRKNIRILLNGEASFELRLKAAFALGDQPATREAIDALARVANNPNEDLTLRQNAISRLAGLSEPDSLRVLLRLIATGAEPGTWIFIEAMQGLRWNSITLNRIANEAVASFLKVGKEAIKRDSPSLLGEARGLIEKLECPTAHSALQELDYLLQVHRTANLAKQKRVALDSSDFDKAAFAVAEIAGLGTKEAEVALKEIRSQPARELEQGYEIDKEDVEAGYSPKWVTEIKSSSELGEALSGLERERWEAARP
ncbi:MAG: HEAT repeat domain-containing protein [Holophaga sp.]|nr:HEAT repeat domain-containing protein [Holophaga sp.]